MRDVDDEDPDETPATGTHTPELEALWRSRIGCAGGPSTAPVNDGSS